MKQLLAVIAFCGCIVASAQEFTHLNLMLRKQLNDLSPSDRIDLFVDANAKVLDNFIEDHEVVIKRQYGSLAQINISAQDLLELDKLDGINSIEYYWAKGQVMNDTMRVNNHVNEVQNGVSPLHQAFTGKGVIVGVVDAGLDVDHPDFQDTLGNTRILKIWDQLASMKWDSSDINAGLCTHKGQLAFYGHGSQVTGIAAGNGRAVDRYKGVAPESDIIAVNSDFNAVSWMSTVVDGFGYILAHADTFKKPCVINASIGTYSGSHDGLDIPALMIDSMIKAKNGRVLVAAAGNAGHIPFHLGYPLSTDTNFTWFKYNSSIGAAFWEVWADSMDFVNASFAVGADKVAPYYQFRGQTAFDQINNRLNKVVLDSIHVNGNNLAYIQTYAEYVRGRYLLQVLINNPDSNQYYFRFSATGNGKLDVWCPFWEGTSEMVASGIPAVATFPDIKYYKRPDTLQTIVSSFQCLQSTITVANYVNTDAYWDYDTVLQNTGLVRGKIAATSSHGPSRQGLTKPDLAATGHNTMSTCDQYIVNLALANSQQSKIGIGGMHKLNGGTSMASPVVAGTAALLLERCPNMSWKEIRDQINITVFTDTFTGGVPNPVWGRGKVNTFAAVSGTYKPYSVVPGGLQEICQGDSISIGMPGGGSNYNWNTGINSSNVFTDTAGLYFGSMNDTSGCLQFSDTVQVAVNALPVKLIVNRSHDTLSVTAGFASYQWYFNGAIIPGETNSMHIAQNTGNYFVYYTDTNGCGNNSDTLNIDFTGLPEIASGNAKVYPNPASNNLSVELPDNYREEIANLTIYAYNGSQVKQQLVTIHDRNGTVDISGLKAGIYLVNIEVQNRSYLCRFSVVY